MLKVLFLSTFGKDSTREQLAKEGLGLNKLINDKKDVVRNEAEQYILTHKDQVDREVLETVLKREIKKDLVKDEWERKETFWAKLRAEWKEEKKKEKEKREKEKRMWENMSEEDKRKLIAFMCANG